MDALNFLKFWRHAAITAASTTTIASSHLVVESDSESSDDEDSFFDLELTVHDLDNKENYNFNNKINGNPPDNTREIKMSNKVDDVSQVDVSKTPLSLSSTEPISKRKILPIEPISKPQSPIALLKSAPSFRIFMFKKPDKKSEKTEWDMETRKLKEKKEAKLFSVKFSIEETNNSPVLSRANSSRSYGSKLRSQSYEESKSERFSKDVLQKYLKLIKPFYVKVSKRYGEKMKFSGEVSSASPMSSPSVASVSSKKEKQGNIQAGIRVVCKHLGKSKSASAATGVTSPASKSDDTLLLQHDGIQSAILHCKRSFQSRDSSSTITESPDLLRKSFEDVSGRTM